MIRYISAVMVVVYLLLPKVNIIPLFGYGLRLQDLLSVFMVGMLPLSVKRMRYRYVLFYIYFSYLIFFGFYINPVSALLEIVRLIQYALIGRFFCLYLIRDKRLLDIVIMSQIFIACLQRFLIIPNYDTGRGMILSDQYSGSFGVSSEFTFAILLLVFMRYHGFMGRILLGSVALLNGTQSAVLYYCGVFYRKNSEILKFVFYWFGFMGSIFLPFLFMGIDVQQFLAYANKHILDIKDFAGYVYVYNGGYGELLSLIQRSIKALGVLEVIVSNPFFVIFGFGFGAILSPVDYGFLRLLANYGLVGVIMFYRIFKILPAPIFYVVVVSNLMFDGLWSSTIGPLMFALYFAYSKNVSLNTRSLHTGTSPFSELNPC